MTRPSSAFWKDTPPAEFIGYTIAALSIILVGAFFQGPILNFIFGPLTVIVAVLVTSYVGRSVKARRAGRERG